MLEAFLIAAVTAFFCIESTMFEAPNTSFDELLFFCNTAAQAATGAPGGKQIPCVGV